MFDVFGDAGTLVALAHFGSVLVQNERNVRELWRRSVEGPVEIEVARGIGEMIFPPQNVGDLHFDVVDDIDEVEDVGTIGAADGHVGFFAVVERGFTPNEIGNGDIGVWGFEAHGAVFFVDETGLFEFGEVLIVDFFAFALAVGGVIAGHVGAFVPVEAEPIEAVEDSGVGFGGVARFVGIFDAEDKFALGVAGVEPVEEGRAGAADVEVAGRGWGEAGADGIGHGRENLGRNTKKDRNNLGGEKRGKAGFACVRLGWSG